MFGSSGVISRNRSPPIPRAPHSVRHFPHDSQQRGDELLVDIHLALVLGETPLAVCLVEDPPLLRRQIDRVTNTGMRKARMAAPSRT